MSLAPLVSDPEAFLRSRFRPLPASVRAIRADFTDGDDDMEEIAALLDGEPGLAATVLELAGWMGEIPPPEAGHALHLVAYLGIARVQQLVLAAWLLRLLPPDLGTEAQRFWFHALFTTRTSQLLARQFGPPADPGGIETAALLHDVGKLVYIKFFPEAFSAMTEICREEGILAADVERRFAYPSHLEIGALLCDYWELRPDLGRACSHHEPQQLMSMSEEDPGYRELRILGAANLIANLTSEELSDRSIDSCEETIRHVLSCTAGDLEGLIRLAREMRSEVERALFVL